MKKLRFILIFFISVLPLSLKAQSGKQRPNVIMIISDDHRYDWMHHKGSEFMVTPNLDQLASEGWSFPNAFCVAGVCSPARAAILTGKYMHQASSPDIVWQNNSFLELQKMFPQRLHEKGYRTGYIGKFHLGEEERPKQGYDLWASFPFVGNFFDQTLWVNGIPKPHEGFTDDHIADFAGKTIREWAKDEQAFCLLVGLKAPHIPFVYPERMKSFYEETVFPEPETFNLDYSESKPGLAKNLINAKTWPHAIPRYGAFQEWVRSYTRLATTIDQSVGKILQALKDAEIEENTIIIYTSDHGYSLGEFSMCEKHYAYEQIMRIPMIVRFPDQQNPGEPPADMVTQMDIAPTIMDYCSGEITAEMEGKSWRELLENKQAKGKPFREEVFFDFWHNAREILPPMQAVRTEEYKFIHYEYQPYEELYDLVNDPIEKYNLINDPGYESVKKDMQNRLENWKKQTGWIGRSVINLQSVYISIPMTIEQEPQEACNYIKPQMSELAGNSHHWKRIERNLKGFNLKNYIPEGNEERVFYLAVPLVNPSDYDPFISFRTSFPENEDTPPPAFTAYFEGKEIYTNWEYKLKNRLPAIESSEGPLRKGFDLGYNPPLPPGENVILIRFITDKLTPDYWDFSIVGACKDLQWL